MTQFLNWLIILTTFAAGSTVLSGPAAFTTLQNYVDSQTNTAAIESAKTDGLVATRGTDGRLYVELHINGEAVRAMVDTGATLSVMRADDAARAGVKITGTTRILTAAGHATVNEGQAGEIIVAGQTLNQLRVLVTDNVPVSLIGMDILKDVGSVSL